MDKKYWIFGIILLALMLRLWGLGQGDALNDETLLAFRSIGPMDYLEAVHQTTPLEWFDGRIPWWTKLSFHDHPPLVFWIQHFFIRLFGETTFAFRLPSVLLGAAAVYFVYAIGTLLFSSGAGLVASLLLAVTVNHLFISRVGLQESYVIFFALAAFYFFLKALKKEKYFLLFGVALGLGLLSKYIAFIIVPIVLTHLWYEKRSAFSSRWLWVGFGVALALFLPVIVYNILMYRATGHFDFQFSYIFGEHPAVWTEAPGKAEAGAFLDRLRNFLPNLFLTNSWLFLPFFGAALLSFMFAAARNFLLTFQRYDFLVIAFFFTALLLFLVGPETRFLTLLTPFLALSLGVAFMSFRKFLSRLSAVVPLLLFGITAFEIFYSLNSQIFSIPYGVSPWTFSSRLRQENYNWGYHELGLFFEKEFKGRVPAVSVNVPYRFLEDLRDRGVASVSAAGATSYPALIVRYGNFDPGGELWTLERLLIYHGWPVITFEDYLKNQKIGGGDYFKRPGAKVYFVVTTNFVPEPSFAMLVKNLSPVTITDARGVPAFRIYEL